MSFAIVSAAIAWSCATAQQAPTCAAGESLCAYCTNIQNDPDNCGKCGTSCPVAQVCSAGQCVSDCPAGNAVCTPDGGSRGYCVDVKNDNANCGKCGTVCSAGQACVNGTCSSSCATNATMCQSDGGGPSFCANLKTDNANCGACGAACPQGEVCAGGTCAGSCTTSQTKCTPDGGAPYCADTDSDNANCGACGVACGTLQVCSGGQCSSNCAPQQTTCKPDGGQPYCADTLTDNTNCGTCGNACPSSKPICSGGSCSDGKCNRTILVLGDGDSNSNSALQTEFQNVGFTVTLQSSGTTTYTGTPSASNFGAIWVGPGLTYATDMPSAGQTAIVNAHTAGTGTGVIFIEWTGFEVTSGRYQTLKQINLINYSGYYVGTQDYTLKISNHPIWNGVSSTFTTSQSISCTVISTLQNGGTTLASSNVCGIGVAINDPSSAGRIVDFAEAGAYASSTWYNDTTLLKVIGNAALWAARCD